MDLTTWIIGGLDKPGKTKGGLARAMGVRASAITEIVQGTRKVAVSEIVPAADYLEIDPPSFFRSRFVPHYGKVAGGASEAVFFGGDDEPIDWIQVPPGSDGSVGALEVDGHSMKGLASNGWYVFFGEKREPPTRDQVEELCVICLKSGQRVVKFLHDSMYEGRYDLHSSNDQPMLAAEVTWAALVTNIIPASQAARLERHSEITDVGEFLKIENFS